MKLLHFNHCVAMVAAMTTVGIARTVKGSDHTVASPHSKSMHQSFLWDLLACSSLSSEVSFHALNVVSTAKPTDTYYTLADNQVGT